MSSKRARTDSHGTGAGAASAPPGPPARISAVSAAADRSRGGKSKRDIRVDLPEVLTQTFPPSDRRHLWVGFPGQQYHALTLLDKEGGLARCGAAVTQTITWDSNTGVSTEYAVSCKADDGIYWFKRAQAYVLGSFTLTFTCNDPAYPDIEPLTRYVPIVAGEGFQSEPRPPNDDIAFLPRGSRISMPWMKDQVEIHFGPTETLAMSRYLWSALRDDQFAARKNKGKTKPRMPPFKPSISDILVAATQKESSFFHCDKNAGLLFCK
jgi:hypothetical protein